MLLGHTATTPAHFALTGLVGLWLAMLTYHDLRTRTVPAWATALPLVLLGLLRTLIIPPDGAVVPGGIAVGLALLMVLLSDTPWVVFPTGAALFCAGLSGFETHVLVGSWVVALVLTALDVWGAGDGKVCAVLTALYPDVELLIALGTTLLLGSAATLIWQRRHRTAARQPLPAIPWLALGTLLYLGSRQLSALSLQ